MYFNQTYDNASQQYFYLTVWNDEAGYPNDIIYQQQGCRPYFSDSLNKYHAYLIADSSLVVNGTFYVGWQQTTDDNLNLGFDRNNDVHSKIFYNTGSGWTNTMFQGALMMRPVLGGKLPEIASVEELVSEENQLQVYPNPSHGQEIFIQLPASLIKEEASCIANIYDMFGRLVYTSPYEKHFNLPVVADGVYILEVSSETSEVNYFTRISIVK